MRLPGALCTHINRLGNRGRGHAVPTMLLLVIAFLTEGEARVLCKITV